MPQNLYKRISRLSRARKLTLVLVVAWLIANIIERKIPAGFALSAALWIGLIAAMVSVVRAEPDEFRRRLFVQGALFSFLAMAVSLPVLDALAQTGIYQPTLESVEAILYVSWAAGFVYLMAKHRFWGDGACAAVEPGRPQ